MIPYKLATTNDKLTSRAGLLALAQLMQSLQLSERIDSLFPGSQNNRGLKPSVYIQTFMLIMHEGSFHLDDVSRLQEDQALHRTMGIDTIPQASSLGAWLRRMGRHKDCLVALRALNKTLLQSALHRRKGITLDIDATEVVAAKAGAQ